MKSYEKNFEQTNWEKRYKSFIQLTQPKQCFEILNEKLFSFCPFHWPNIEKKSWVCSTLLKQVLVSYFALQSFPPLENSQKYLPRVNVHFTEVDLTLQLLGKVNAHYIYFCEYMCDHNLKFNQMDLKKILNYFVTCQILSSVMSSKVQITNISFHIKC